MFSCWKHICTCKWFHGWFRNHGRFYFFSKICIFSYHVHIVLLQSGSASDRKGLKMALFYVWKCEKMFLYDMKTCLDSTKVPESCSSHKIRWITVVIALSCDCFLWLSDTLQAKEINTITTWAVLQSWLAL